MDDRSPSLFWIWINDMQTLLSHDMRIHCNLFSEMSDYFMKGIGILIN